MLATNWCKLLVGEQIYGEDVSFSPDFESLQAEIDKCSSIYDCGTTDWSVVMNLADKILTNDSKDIWVFAYGIIAHYHQHGLLVFAETLSKSTDFMVEHWNGLYPPIHKKQRRLAPFLWIQTQTKQWDNNSPYQNTDSSEHKLVATQSLEKLHCFLTEKFEDNAPVFACFSNDNTSKKNSTSTHNETMQNSDVSSSVQNTQQENTSAMQSVTGQDSIINQVPPDNINIIPKNQQAPIIRDIIDNGRRLATHILSQNILDERAFFLHRAVIWGTLMQLPPCDSNGKTQLSSGIPQDKILEYAAAFENKQYREILYNLEISTGKSPFWLDGHYMVARCLEELKADIPYQMLKSAFIQLVKRFPALLNYTFSNGMPFASPFVHEWYSIISSDETSQKNIDISEYNPIMPNDESNILHEALILGKEHNFHTGLRHLGKASSGRNKTVFTLGILQAKYCIQFKKKEIALQLLEALYSQLKDWEMLDWEPELTVQILSLLLSCKIKDLSTETIEQKRLLYRLNLDAALNLSMSA